MQRREVILYRRFGTTYRFHLQGSRDSSSLTFKMGPIHCPETSVKDYHSTLRNIPEEQRSHTLLCYVIVLVISIQLLVCTLYLSSSALQALTISSFPHRPDTHEFYVAFTVHFHLLFSDQQMHKHKLLIFMFCLSTGHPTCPREATSGPYPAAARCAVCLLLAALQCAGSALRPGS